MLQRITLIFWVAVVMLPTLASAVTIFSVGGDDTTASIQATVDSYRAALGSPNNGNAPGGRREINWDGGGSDVTTPPVTPFNVFLNTRGGQFITLGTGLTQAPPSGGPQGGLATINATYATTFSTFSDPRLFAPIGSNITEALFFLPGTAGALATTVKGFGAVFTDVDIAGSTTLEFFDFFGNALGTPFIVPAGSVADGSLSFLGVLFGPGEGSISRVRITTGNTALGPTDGGTTDVVVMDDFFYSEPQVVPEPSTLALLGIGAVALFGVQRYRKMQRARLG
jgi:hypothetical protein